MLRHTHLDKLLNCFDDVGIKLFDLNSSEVHVAEQAVDDLQKRLLHAGKALIQQLKENNKSSK